MTSDGRGYLEALEWLARSLAMVMVKYAPVLALLIVGWVAAFWGMQRAWGV